VPLRVKLACLLAFAPAVFGCWQALRDSGLFSVDRVAIEGLSAGAAPIVTQDLVSAARAQTTTDFRLGMVREAVAQFSLIVDVRARTHFPHGVTLIVRERVPAVRLELGRRTIALAADGTVITGLARLPALAGVRSTQAPSGGSTHDPFVLLALNVLAAAPAPLRERVVAVTAARGMLTIHLHRGPRLIFGNGALPHAKWDAAAAVLADASSRGATYVDVELPARPSAQVGDPTTTLSALSLGGSSAVTPATAAAVATTVNSALLRASVSTSG